MFCHGCGHRLEESVTFCPNCGIALGSAATGEPSSPPKPPVKPVLLKSSIRDKLKQKPVVIALVVGFLALVWISSHKHPPTTIDSPSNINRQTNYDPGGNPPSQGYATGGNTSKQEVVNAYNSFMQESNEIGAVFINGAQLNPEASFFSKQAQQYQYLLNKLSGLPNFPEAAGEIAQFKRAQHAYLAAMSQYSQYLATNPMTPFPQQIQTLAQASDEAGRRLFTKLYQ